MKTIFRLSLLWLGFCLSFAQAGTINPTLRLVSIKALEQSEKSGDELYMAVTVYPSNGRPSHQYYPKQPLHWASEHLDKLKPTEIWAQRGMKAGDKVTIVIALIERDTPPWNTDDLIGEVELQLRHDLSGLKSAWSVLTRGAHGTIVDHPKNSSQKVARLHGKGGHYKLTFELSQ